MSDTALLLTRVFQFAALAHTDQRRKGRRLEPYINHPAEVASLIAEATGGSDANLLAAALLHDVVEDTEYDADDIRQRFGDDVAELVAAVTDDKGLAKDERKRRQIEKAPKLSDRAKLLKIADKTSNLRSIVKSTPDGWTAERCRDYFAWAKAVADQCRGINAALEAAFDEAYAAGMATDFETLTYSD